MLKSWTLSMKEVHKHCNQFYHTREEYGISRVGPYALVCRRLRWEGQGGLDYAANEFEEFILQRA